MLQRKHQSSLQDLTTLRSQDEASQENSTKPQAACFGEVVRDSRKNGLDTAGRLFRHLAGNQMSTNERPRDVPGEQLTEREDQEIHRSSTL